jgi:DNA-binding NarL/FixJ family response regulator
VPTGIVLHPSTSGTIAATRALAAAGQRRAAIDTLAAAESALDRFGARRLRDEAARELRRLGHRVLPPARTPRPGAPAPLTAREHEIAPLVATGHTNPEIAAQLVLSPRTIDAHPRRIYAKLGLRSRVELARELR